MLGRARDHGMRRFRKYLWRVVIVLSVLWIAFLLFLDLRYGMLPRTLMGGLKILGFCLVVPLVVDLLSRIFSLWRGRHQNMRAI